MPVFDARCLEQDEAIDATVDEGLQMLFENRARFAKTCDQHAVVGLLDFRLDLGDDLRGEVVLHVVDHEADGHAAAAAQAPCGEVGPIIKIGDGLLDGVHVLLLEFVAVEVA